MKLWSVAFSYRLGLGFHALNNEGADGSNLMQPRRIDVGEVTYDGISGEIIRHHILENFVSLCNRDDLPLLPVSQALHPDRGPIGIRLVAKAAGCVKLTKANPSDLYRAVRRAIEKCAVLDVGGYLAAFAAREEAAEEPPEEPQQQATPQVQTAARVSAVAPESAIMTDLAELGGRNDGGAPYSVKRDSVFDAAWLVSESHQDSTVTQHSAYRPSGKQSLFSQTMRSNVYGGVIRAELHRIGNDDYWYLQSKVERLALTAEQQLKRQQLLIESIVNFIVSPTGAKVAAWAPHVFLTEGVILLTSIRTAPFVSPIRVDLGNKDAPVGPNTNYEAAMNKLKNDTDTWVWPFKSADELLVAGKRVTEKLREK
jgi:CRISPR-associated protein Cst2